MDKIHREGIDVDVMLSANLNRLLGQDETPLLVKRNFIAEVVPISFFGKLRNVFKHPILFTKRIGFRLARRLPIRIKNYLKSLSKL